MERKLTPIQLRTLRAAMKARAKPRPEFYYTEENVIRRANERTRHGLEHAGLIESCLLDRPNGRTFVGYRLTTAGMEAASEIVHIHGDGGF